MNDKITTEKLLAAYLENGGTWRRYMKRIYSDWKPGIIKQIVLSGGSEEDYCVDLPYESDKYLVYLRHLCRSIYLQYYSIYPNNPILKLLS